MKTAAIIIGLLLIGGLAVAAVFVEQQRRIADSMEVMTALAVKQQQVWLVAEDIAERAMPQKVASK